MEFLLVDATSRKSGNADICRSLFVLHFSNKSQGGEGGGGSVISTLTLHRRGWGVKSRLLLGGMESPSSPCASGFPPVSPSSLG